MKRILIVDDHAVVRRGVRQLLQEILPDAIYGEAEQPHEALAQIEKGSWDLVVLDLSLPGRGGLDALKEMKRLHPQLPVVVLSMHPESQYAVRALRAGAAGYVMKGSDPSAIGDAVRSALAGGTYVGPAQAEALARALRVGGSAPAHERLSDRELEVLKGIASGLSVKEIAGKMVLSEKTISTYRSRLLGKLTLVTNADLVQYARREGLVE